MTWRTSCYSAGLQGLTRLFPSTPLFCSRMIHKCITYLLPPWLPIRVGAVPSWLPIRVGAVLSWPPLPCITLITDKTIEVSRVVFRGRFLLQTIEKSDSQSASTYFHRIQSDSAPTLPMQPLSPPWPHPKPAPITREYLDNKKQQGNQLAQQDDRAHNKESKSRVTVCSRCFRRHCSVCSWNENRKQVERGMFKRMSIRRHFTSHCSVSILSFFISLSP